MGTPTRNAGMRNTGIFVSLDLRYTSAIIVHHRKSGTSMSVNMSASFSLCRNNALANCQFHLPIGKITDV
jgi:hypothetical protein